MKLCRALSCVLLLATSLLWAQDMTPIILPTPQKTGGQPLFDCLLQRHSSREFAATELSPAELSTLLWAACGINRADGHRTAPSARNWQEIEIYAVMESGAYKYDAAANQLVPVAAGDLRALTGMQPFVKDAPLNLVYVADFAKMSDAPEDAKTTYSAADAGFIAENVYLYCASENLACVVRGSIEKEPLAKALKLAETQKIVLAQTVGHVK